MNYEEKIPATSRAWCECGWQTWGVWSHVEGRNHFTLTNHAVHVLEREETYVSKEPVCWHCGIEVEAFLDEKGWHAFDVAIGATAPFSAESQFCQKANLLAAGVLDDRVFPLHGRAE